MGVLFQLLSIATSNNTPTQQQRHTFSTPDTHSSSHQSRPVSTVIGRWANKGDNRRQEQEGGRDKLIEIGYCGDLTKKKKTRREKERWRWGVFDWVNMQRNHFSSLSKTLSWNPWNGNWVVADWGIAVVLQCWSLAGLSLLDYKTLWLRVHVSAI